MGPPVKTEKAFSMMALIFLALKSHLCKSELDSAELGVPGTTGSAGEGLV